MRHGSSAFQMKCPIRGRIHNLEMSINPPMSASDSRAGGSEQIPPRIAAYAIDIGMDVHGKESPVIGGQVILSSPDGLCMRNIGFLTNEKLAQEAARYGDVVGREQVIWPSGVLASTAVGMAVDLVTNWTRKCRSP
jgi:hypothetical protein